MATSPTTLGTIDIAPLRRRALAELCRRSLKRFVREAWHVLEPSAPVDWNWHLDALCDHIQALIEDWVRVQLSAREVLEDGSFELAAAYRLGLALHLNRVAEQVEQRIQNLLVNVPPGTAKSRVVAVMTPAWMWTIWPSWRAIFLSVNPRVAMRDSVYCRELITSVWYQELFEPDWTLSEDQDTKGLFKNTRGGWRMALGYFAQMVGERGDALFVDDANDPEEVHSPVHRSGVNDRWDNVLKNRLNDLRSSSRCVIQQRVHVDDQSGHILATEPDEWDHLRITMEREADDKGCECPSCKRGTTRIGWKDPRAPGELMFPKRFPESVLAPFRAKSMVWTSQYQQRPVPAEGNMFKPSWWRFWRYAHQDEVPGLEDRTVVVPDTFDREALSVDCAFVKTAGSDLVAAGAWGEKGPDRYLLELTWKKLTFRETVDAVRELAGRHPKAREKIIENKANGPAVINTLKDEIGGLIPFDPKDYGSKESRAAATSIEVESGNVFIPLHAPWREKYIEEHKDFPGGVHDDAVDQQSQVLLRWATKTTAKHAQKPGQYGGRRM